MKSLARLHFFVGGILLILAFFLTRNIFGQIDSSTLNRNLIPENRKVDHDSIYPTYGVKVAPKDFKKVGARLDPLLIGCGQPACYPVKNGKQEDIELLIEFKGNEFQSSIDLQFNWVELDTAEAYDLEGLSIFDKAGNPVNFDYTSNTLRLAAGSYTIKDLLKGDSRLVQIRPFMGGKPPSDSSRYDPIFFSLDQIIETNSFFERREERRINEPYILQIDFIPVPLNDCLGEYSASQDQIDKLIDATSSLNFNPINGLLRLDEADNSIKDLPFLIIKGTVNDTPLIFIDAECNCRFTFGCKFYDDKEVFPIENFPSIRRSNSPADNVAYYFYYMGGIRKSSKFESSLYIFSQNHKVTFVPLFVAANSFTLSGLVLGGVRTLPINVVIADSEDDLNGDETKAVKEQICQEVSIANCILRANRAGLRLEKLSINDIKEPLPNGQPDLYEALDLGVSYSFSSSFRRFYVEDNIRKEFNKLSSLSLDTYFVPDAINIYVYQNREVFRGVFVRKNIIFLGRNRGPVTLVHEIGHALGLNHVTKCEFRCNEDGANNLYSEDDHNVERLKSINVMCLSSETTCQTNRYTFSIGQVMKMNTNPLSNAQEFIGKIGPDRPCRDNCDDFQYDLTWECPCTGLTGKGRILREEGGAIVTSPSTL